LEKAKELGFNCAEPYPPGSTLIDEMNDPVGIAAILRSHGFCAIQDIDFQEIASRFRRAVQGLAPGHAGVHVVHAKRS
jgi:hypothetical protein